MVGGRGDLFGDVCYGGVEGVSWEGEGSGDERFARMEGEYVLDAGRLTNAHM